MTDDVHSNDGSEKKAQNLMSKLGADRSLFNDCL